MAILATFYRNRTADEQITFYDVDGEEIVIANGDKVRIKIGRPGELPLLDIVSGTPLAGSSQVSAANPATLRLAQDDTADLQPGHYELEASIVDHADSDFIKHAESGVLHLLDTQLGEY